MNAASVADVTRRVAAKQEPEPGPAPAPPAAAESATSGSAGSSHQGTGTDMAPVTVAGEAQAVAAAAEVARYRPNILFGGGGLVPFAEDGWRAVQLGASHFSVDGGCSARKRYSHSVLARKCLSLGL